MRRGALIVAVCAYLAGCTGEIPVVGLDADGKDIETLVPHGRFESELQKSVDRMTESVVPVADSEQYGRLLSGLRTIRVGLGLSGSVGLGDYWKLGGNIGFDLFFTNMN